jgi:hypothetical protein
MFHKIYTLGMRKAFDCFFAHHQALLLYGILSSVAIAASGCVNQLFLTWNHPLLPSSPRPLIWRRDWPVTPGKWLPVRYYFDQDHSVRVEMLPSPNGPIVKESGSFEDPRPAPASDALPPGSTVVRLTFPEGSQDYLVNAATGSLSVVTATQPSTQTEK